MGKDSFMLVSLKENKAKKLAQVLSNPTSTRILDHLTKGDSTETEISKKLKIPLSTVHYNLKQLVEAKLVVVEEFHYSPKGKEVNHYKLANKYIIIAPDETEGLFEKLKKYIPVAVITVGVSIVLKAMQLFTGTAFSGESKLSTSDAAFTAQSTVSELPPRIKADEDAVARTYDAAAEPAAELIKETASETAGSSQIAAGSGSVQSAGAVPAELLEDAADDVVNETIVEAMNESVSETVNETVQETVQTAAAEPAVVYAIPWWQSAIVDWMILGALSVLLILILVEIWRHMRR